MAIYRMETRATLLDHHHSEVNAFWPRSGPNLNNVTTTDLDRVQMSRTNIPDVRRVRRVVDGKR